MRVRLAPGWLDAAVRSLLLLGAALLIAAIMYSANGPPTLSRKSKFDEFAIFNHAFGQGVGELVTETLVLIGLTWWFRDGLRVRLEAKQRATPTRFDYTHHCQQGSVQRTTGRITRD
jgi:hypothetical protein